MPNKYGSGARRDPESGIAFGLAVPVVVLPRSAVAAEAATAVSGTGIGHGEIVTPLADSLHRLAVKAGVVGATHAVEMFHSDAEADAASVMDDAAWGDRAVGLDPSEPMGELQDAASTDNPVAVTTDGAFPEDAVERVICHTKSV